MFEKWMVERLARKGWFCSPPPPPPAPPRPSPPATPMISEGTKRVLAAASVLGAMHYARMQTAEILGLAQSIMAHGGIPVAKTVDPDVEPEEEPEPPAPPPAAGPGTGTRH